jgi:hypothetical protein
MKKLIFFFLLLPSYAFTQEYVRGIVPIFGFEEGAAVITKDNWQVVSKDVYTQVKGMFNLPVLDNTIREYYLGFRHSANINSCSDNSNPVNPEVRFYFTYHNKGGHKFQISRVWGFTNQGIIQWVKIPESEYQALQAGLSITGTSDRWRLDARIPSNCEGKTLKIFGIWLMAVDKVGGAIPTIDWADDGVASESGNEIQPLDKLTIKGPSTPFGTGSSRDIIYDFAAGGKTYIRSYRGSSWDTYLQFMTSEYSNSGGEPSVKMHINGDGNVGIGTTTPDAKLTVKGDIHTQEIKVDLSGALVPDYVFEEDYPLPSLAETEIYIKANKHLPEVPSAKEMEENGIDLKRMNLLLLKKIEELTLYLIQLEEKNNFLEQENQELKEYYVENSKLLQQLMVRMKKLENE